MIVVAGGGVAGSVASCLLRLAGRPVLLLERETGPHDKVCGEFLSHEATAVLRQTGLDPLALGAAPIGAVRLVHGRFAAAAALPFPAHGLSRRALDEALIGRAAGLGAEVVRGHAVRAAEGTRLLLDGGVVDASVVFLATGKHDLRGARRVPQRKPEPLVGFKTHLRLRPDARLALRGTVEIITFRGGYAGLQLVERDRANLCLLVRRERLAEEGGTWVALLGALCAESEHLARRLDGAAELFERPLTVSRVPYGFLYHPDAADPAGVFRLGDQMAVIPSFSGDGMAIAAYTAQRAVEAFLAGRGATEYHGALRRALRPQLTRAGRLYRVGRRAPWLTVAVARLWPGLMRRAALLTRVPTAG